MTEDRQESQERTLADVVYEGLLLLRCELRRRKYRPGVSKTVGKEAYATKVSLRVVRKWRKSLDSSLVTSIGRHHVQIISAGSAFTRRYRFACSVNIIMTTTRVEQAKSPW